MALKLDFSKVLVKDNTNRTTKAESDILQQAQLIALRVTTETFNALAGRMSGAEASIILQASQIASKVATSDFNALNNRVGSAESSIVQQANNIASKVSSTDFTGNTIASLINQSAAEVKIQASKITLEGLITANDNFKVLLDGSIEAVNAKLSGAITATKMVALSNPAYYGEIGLSGGYIGLGLFDLNKGTEAFCEILELPDGFALRDKNNLNRFTATAVQTTLRDYDNSAVLNSSAGARAMFSPNQKNYIIITNDIIQIVKNGVVKASW